MVKVMVSSTIKDLLDERRAIKEVIDGLGFEVLMSEVLGSRGIPSRVICLQMVRECDLYILIIGKRYGTLLEGEDISITEMEFHEAKRQREIRGLEILGYVKEVDDRTEREKIFLKKVEDFRKGIFRGKTFKTIEDLITQFKLDLGRNLIVRRMEPQKINISKFPRRPDSMFYRLIFYPMFCRINLYEYGDRSWNWFRDNIPKAPDGILIFHDFNPKENLGFEYTVVSTHRGQMTMLVQKDGLIDYTNIISNVNYRHILHYLYLISKWATFFYKKFGYGKEIQFSLLIGNAFDREIRPNSYLGNRTRGHKCKIKLASQWGDVIFEPYNFNVNVVIELFNKVFYQSGLIINSEAIINDLKEVGLINP